MAGGRGGILRGGEEGARGEGGKGGLLRDGGVWEIGWSDWGEKKVGCCGGATAGANFSLGFCHG